MDPFSFLMIKVRLEYYENMISRIQKEEHLRPSRNRQQKEKRRAVDARTTLFESSTTPTLRCPLEKAHD
jgi:hypothetical protein